MAQEEELLNNEEGEIAVKDGDSEDNFVHNKHYAKIQVLNKITAKTKYLNIKVNSEILFDSLKIKVLSCWKSSPYELTENKILLEVWDKKVESEEYQELFKGWMFSSSPGISSIEHPVYDIVAINCSD